MTTLELENKLADIHLTYLQTLSEDIQRKTVCKWLAELDKQKEEVEKNKVSQKEFIALKNSMDSALGISKIDISNPKISPEEYFAGAWDSDQTPEEFAESLRSARYFDRKLLEL